MVLMGGILIGLAEGMMNSFKHYYSSDILVKPNLQLPYISQPDIVENIALSLPSYKAHSKRFLINTTIEDTRKIKIKETDINERINIQLVGINPVSENRVTGLSKKVIEGKFIERNDIDKIVVGKGLLSRYSKGSSTEPRLNNVTVGTKLAIIYNNKRYDVIVSGIIDSGNSTTDSRVFVSDSFMRFVTNNNLQNAGEIAILLDPNSDKTLAKKIILENYPYKGDIVVETAEESLPKAIIDMKKTFSMLGNLVGVISLIVGSITIFIVIFINAVTRRKYIGIMKGIGISALSIQVSYIFQSLFYALSGIIIAGLIVMLWLKPWFEIHPLKFPVTEGRLSVSLSGLLVRALILSMTAFISGYIPARIITKQNTLDAILGR